MFGRLVQKDDLGVQGDERQPPQFGLELALAFGIESPATHSVVVANCTRWRARQPRIEIAIAMRFAESRVVGYGQHNGQEHAFMLDIGGSTLCIDNVKTETKDVSTGNWVDVADHATYDGNLVRFEVTLHNVSSHDRVAQLRLH